MGDVSIEVSDGTTPTFSWSPPHPMTELDVDQEFDVGSAGVWRLDSDSLAIVPPVVYAIVPPGTRGVKDPVPLMQGATYSVSLWCTEGFMLYNIATTTFSPQGTQKEGDGWLRGLASSVVLGRSHLRPN
jgi:hypothetical protein